MYAVVRPLWSWAGAQLAAFLAYDLVLIPSLLAHTGEVPDGHELSLALYLGGLLFSPLSPSTRWNVPTVWSVPEGIHGLIARMQELEAGLISADDERRYFHSTYLRITQAVSQALERGDFVDPPWVERWDVVFAGLYLDALEQWDRGQQPSTPWALAFTMATEEDLPPLRHVLVGTNAHVNYDLPQALLAVMTDEDFDDPEMVARREQDHTRLDRVLAERVAAEDKELEKVEQPGDRTVLDRAMVPFSRLATKRFLRESRAKVWRNATLLSTARRQGQETLVARLGELEELSRARVADLSVPGQVLIKLAVKGFGVRLSE